MPFSRADIALFPAVTGCDEVGRGPLCGPVVVAAVWFDPRLISPDLLEELDDSKALSPAKRTRLAGLIRSEAKVALAAGSAREIDARGIRTMTLDAMRRAILALGIKAPVRIDGCDIPPQLQNLLECRAVIRGDSLVPQIAAASIIAKAFRDALMCSLGARYPGYGWDHNAGYGTPEHLRGLALLGPTCHHRLSFAPLSQRALGESVEP